MKIVGIDFSMTSTAICVDIDGVEHFHSITSSVSENRLDCIKSYGIDSIQLYKTSNGDSISESEIEKVKKSNIIAESILTILKNYNVNFDIIGIENFSYGGTGRGILDLAGFQYVLRASLYNNSMANKYMFHTPASVKKFAIKGNAKKNEIIEAYLDLNIDNNLTKILKSQDCGLYSKQGNWQKPVDDLVDSYFIKEFSKI